MIDTLDSIWRWWIRHEVLVVEPEEWACNEGIKGLFAKELSIWFFLEKRSHLQR